MLYKTVANTLIKNGFEAHLVGGAVRNLELGIPVHDFDLASDALPEQLMEIVMPEGVKTFPQGIKYGTVSYTDGNETVEVTTFRGEHNHNPNNRRDVEISFSKSIEEDLSRRDFTINAMAINLANNEMIDPFDGMEDLWDYRLKMVGDSKQRLLEDPLRALRGARMAVICPNVDEEFIKACQSTEVQDGIRSLSAERKGDEFFKIMSLNVLEIPKAFQILIDTDVLSLLLPELKRCIGVEQNEKYHSEDVYGHIMLALTKMEKADIHSKFAILFHDLGKVVAKTPDGKFIGHEKISVHETRHIFQRLKLNRYLDEKIVCHLVSSHMKFHMALRDPKSGKPHRLLTKAGFFEFGEEHLNRILEVGMADLKGRQSYSVTDIMSLQKHITYLKKLIKEMDAFSLRDLQVDGHDVMKITGCGPGKYVGQMLKYLFQKVVDGELYNHREFLIQKIKEKGQCDSNKLTLELSKKVVQFPSKTNEK